MIQFIRWQSLIALIGILLVATMLAALSDRLDTVVVPQAGGTYIEALPARPGNLNPFYNQTRTDTVLTALLFNGLTQADATGNLLPDLARRWDISEDGRRYTFYLRRDARWHDGTPFSAYDVAFTIGVIRDPAFTGRTAATELWRTIAVEVDDPYTVRFILPEALAPFAPFLSYTTLAILPRHLLQEVPVAELSASAFSEQPIGTGPWRVAQIGAEQVVLEPHAATLPRPMLDRLVLRFYDSGAEALAAYQRGEARGVGQVEPDALPTVLSDPALSLYPTTVAGYTALFFNLQRPAFQSLQVREALMLGLDRQALIDEVLAGQGTVADGFLMPTHWAYEGDLPRYPHAPTEARALLEEAGWVDRTDDRDTVRDRDSVPLEITLLADESDPQLVALAAAIEAQWAKIGVRVVPQPVTGDALREALQSRNFDIVALATPLSGLPPDPDFYPLWHSSQATGDGPNITSYASEEADRLLVEGRRVLDPAERHAIYAEFQAMLAEELPALPLYHPIYNYAVSAMVNEVQLGPMASNGDRFDSLPQWYIRTQRLVVEQGAPTPTPARNP